jgi:CheY-like chemotaxis protein
MPNRKVLLLIEDNPSDVDLTKRAFERHRISNPLVVAEDGREALDFLFGEGVHGGRDLSDAPALVLLDLKLPKVSGFDVLARIRKDPRTRRQPVVILTSSKEEEDIARGYDLGTNGYVRKPVDYTEFAKAAERLGLYWLLLNEPPPPAKARTT